MAGSFLVKLCNIEKSLVETFYHPYIKLIICACSKINFSIPLLIYWPSCLRKKLILSCFPTSWSWSYNLISWMVWSYNLNARYPLTNEVSFWSIINIWCATKVIVSCILSFYQGLSLVIPYMDIPYTSASFDSRFFGGAHNPLLNHSCAKSLMY